MKRGLEAIAKAGISPQQFLVLHLADTTHPSMSGIALSTLHSNASVTGIVERMIKLQLVQRVVEPEDRRIIRIVPTVQGVAILDKISKDLEQPN